MLGHRLLASVIRDSTALPVQVDPRGKMWNRLRASIGQPNFE